MFCRSLPRYTGDKDEKKAHDYWAVILVASVVMILVLLVYRLCAPLSAAYDWVVEGNEKTVDRSSSHVAGFESGTSADDVAKEHQYATQPQINAGLSPPSDARGIG